MWGAVFRAIGSFGVGALMATIFNAVATPILAVIKQHAGPEADIYVWLSAMNNWLVFFFVFSLVTLLIGRAVVESRGAV